MRINKRAVAEAAIILWIIAIIAGILIANKTGLFNIYTPQVQQPAGTDSLVFQQYYPATDQAPIACQNLNYVRFRTTDLTYVSGTAVAYTATCGQTLTAYGKTQGVCSTITCNMAPEMYVPTSTGTAKFFTDGTDVCICNPGEISTQNPRRYTTSDSDASKANVQSLSIPSEQSKEVACPTTPIKDDGIYVCSGGNVATQYCGTFGVETSGVRPDGIVKGEICPPVSPCTPISAQPPEGPQLAVQCGSSLKPYKPGKQLCVGTLGGKRYFTTSDGSSINYEQCGWMCSQVGETATCINCQDGWEKCNAANNWVDTCIGGVYLKSSVPADTCEGEQYCTENSITHVAYCTSDTPTGTEECGGHGFPAEQPVRFNGFTWVTNGDACDIGCYKDGSVAKCIMECTILGVSCNSVEAKLGNCLASDRDNELQIYPPTTDGRCISSQCSATDNAKCSPFRTTGKYCYDGDVWEATPDLSVNYILNGGIKTELLQSCGTNGCNPLTFQCNPLPDCVGDGDGSWVCKADGVTKIKCSADKQQILETEVCSSTYPRGTCQVAIGDDVCQQAEPVCSGEFACNNGVIEGCFEGFFTGAQLNNCNFKGCTGDSDTTAQCNDECFGAKVCDGATSYDCSSVAVRDLDNFQKIKTSPTTCYNGCNQTSGLCLNQCTPGVNFCSGDTQYSCSAGGIPNELWNCGGAGCKSSGTACNDFCLGLGNYTCQTGVGGIKLSAKCVQNTTTQQKIYETTPCLTDCNAITGRCLRAGTANSYLCDPEPIGGFGGVIKSTDANGDINGTAEDCRKAINGFQAFCVEGQPQCKACYNQVRYCSVNQTYTCTNELTGAKGDIDNCEVSCGTITGGIFCDNLAITIGKTTFAKDDKNVVVSLNLKGSVSGNAVVTSYTLYLNSSGYSDQKAGTSGSYDGAVSQSFGDLPIGTYTARLSLLNYPAVKNQVSFQVKVTDSYIIDIKEGKVSTLLPGKTAKITLEAIKDSKSPGSLSITTRPEGLTLATLNPSGVTGRWTLEVDGEPGIYKIGIKPSEGDEQEITFELRKAGLSIETNLPSSFKPTTKQFDINVKAPDANGVNNGIKPDFIKASISSKELILSELGSGSYTTNYDFSTAGTYVLLISATKSGYTEINKTVIVQASDSGTASAPGTNQTGTGGGSGGGGGGGDNQTIIFILVGVLAYLLFGGKKK